MSSIIAKRTTWNKFDLYRKCCKHGVNLFLGWLPWVATSALTLCPASIYTIYTEPEFKPCMHDRTSGLHILHFHSVSSLISSPEYIQASLFQSGLYVSFNFNYMTVEFRNFKELPHHAVSVKEEGSHASNPNLS